MIIKINPDMKQASATRTATNNSADQLTANDPGRRADLFKYDKNHIKTEKAKNHEKRDQQKTLRKAAAMPKNIDMLVDNSATQVSDGNNSQMCNSAQTPVEGAFKPSRKSSTFVQPPVGQDYVKLYGRSNGLHRSQIDMNELVFAMVIGVVKPSDFKIPNRVMTDPNARGNIKMDVRCINLLREMYDCRNNEQTKTRVMRNSKLVIPERPTSMDAPDEHFEVHFAEPRSDDKSEPIDTENPNQMLINDGVVHSEFEQTPCETVVDWAQYGAEHINALEASMTSGLEILADKVEALEDSKFAERLDRMENSIECISAALKAIGNNAVATMKGAND